MVRTRTMRVLRRPGVTFFEVLVAALIFATSLAAMVSLWYFSYSMSAQSADKAIAYNLARQRMEQIHETGFFNTSEYPTTGADVHYFDSNGANQDSNTSQARYIVTTTVVSNVIKTGSSPTAPANNALRTVTITVTLASGGSTVYTTSTYLTRGGL